MMSFIYLMSKDGWETVIVSFIQSLTYPLYAEIKLSGEGVESLTDLTSETSIHLF
jgi:hypothetical protein